MQNDKEPFTSKFVDEQIERLAHPDEIHRTSADQQALTPETQLVQDMSRLYQEYAGTRDRVWQRLEQHMQQPSLTQRPITGKLMLNEREPRMIPRMIQRELERRGRAGYHLTLIAAAFIIVLLVGSMVLIPPALISLRNSIVGGPGKAPTVLPPTVTPFARPRITPTEVPPGPTCQASQLALTYESSQVGMGNRADQFSLRNDSNSTCTLFGYPHIQLLNADSQPISTHITQVTSAYLFQSSAPQAVSLQAGAKSYFIVEWVTGMCAGYSSPSLIGAFLQVTPAGATSALTTSASSGVDGGIDACGDVVVSPISAVNDFIA